MKINFLNNVKLKHKLILIYVLCVVAPIIIINVVFYQNMKTNVKKIQGNYYRLFTERITTKMENDLNTVVTLANKISLDQKFYKMLDKNYKSQVDYVDVYYNYFIDYLYLNGESYEQISESVIYTNNPTVMDSGIIHKIDNEVKNKDWYERVIKAPDKLHVFYEQGQKFTPISIVKVIDEYGSMDRYLKIIKIKLNMDNFINVIKEENIKGNVFIFNKDGDIIYKDANLSYRLAQKYYLKGNESTNEFIKTKIDKYFDWTLINIIDQKDIKLALQEPRNKIILLTLISLFLSSLVIFLIYRSFYTRLNSLSKHVSRLDLEDFNKQYSGRQGKDEIGSLIRAYNRMVRKIKTLVMDVYEAQLEQSNINLEKKQAEIKALQSQMNPHFLFNTLESIRMKSLEKGEKETAEIIKYLARSFRQMITFKKEWVNVSEEVDYIKGFLKIEKYRFGSEFEYKLEVNPKALNIKIPKLIIQPFVENSCIHGLVDNEKVGKVSIKIDVVDDKLVCIIKDNGIGIKQKQLKCILNKIKNNENDDSSIAIENIYRRLDLYYDNKFDLVIESEEGKGTIVKLIIPTEV
ncbi:MAG: histidine kinase [Halothermotrichaceae bacterium]